MAQSGNGAARAYDVIDHEYDVVVVDCPPQLGYLTLTALSAASSVLITVHPQMLDLMSMSQFLLMLGDILKTIRQAGGEVDLDWFRYLVTRYEPTDIPQAQMVGFMQSMLAEQMLKNEMLKSTAISDAVSIPVIASGGVGNLQHLADAEFVRVPDLRIEFPVVAPKQAVAEEVMGDGADGVAGFDVAILHADLKTSGHDVREHHQRLFVGTCRDRVERIVAMGNADIFGLCAVDLMAKNPTAIRAMGVKLTLTIGAFAA